MKEILLKLRSITLVVLITVFTANFAKGQYVGKQFTNGDLKYEITQLSPKKVKVIANDPRPTGDIEIPSTVNYNGANYTVTRIGQQAFLECNYLTSIIIPNSVRTIGGGAFFACGSLTSIEIPNSVKTIGGSAFFLCNNLQTVTIPNPVTTIGEVAFSSCRNLKTVYISSSVENIGFGAFGNNLSLEAIEVNNNHSYASVDGVLFNKSKTKLIEYPGGRPNKKYIIPYSVRNIGRMAFSYCKKLEAITIPHSVQNIEESAFEECTNMKTINSQIENVNNVTLDDNVFRFIDKDNCILYVPEGKVDEYRAAPQWQDFNNIKVEGDIGEPNTSRYITLTVANGQDIKLNLAADADNTPIRIESGSQVYNITAGTDTIGTQNYMAEGTTMTIYGDVNRFYCGSNEANVTDVDISNNTALIKLWCYNNQLTSLNVSNNTALTHLDCWNNQISNLDVSNNTNLTYLACSKNNLNDLDVSNNIHLDTLWCNRNPLKTLNVSNNTDLISLSCWDNQLNTLDVSKNTNLKSLGCAKNQLDSLNVNNNKNLTFLSCFDNKLKKLDIKYNTKLEGLDCSNNQISHLWGGENNNLTTLHCWNNELTQLHINSNENLQVLSCDGNKLTALDLSNNNKLETIWCYNNPFTYSDLDMIYCSLPDRNSTSSGTIYVLNNKEDYNYNNVIDANKQNAINKNWKVYYYDDYNGNLFNTDIPETTSNYVCGTPNTDRHITITVEKGGSIELQITADVKNTPIKIKNGNSVYNAKIGTNMFPTYITAKSTEMTFWGNITYFSCSGNLGKVKAVDVSNNKYLKGLYCHSNLIEGNLDLSNNTNLQSLDIAVNRFTNLDISKNKNLKWLDCGGNRLNNLDVSQNTALIKLHCSGNNISNLDISKNIALKNLDCERNNLQNLDISKNKNLKWLYCGGNRLNSLDVSQNTALIKLHCSGDNISNLDISKNIALKNLDCERNNLQNLDISKNTMLKILGCSENELQNLDISNNTILKELFCSENKLTSLDISKNTNLEKIECYKNPITTTELDKIYCSLPDRNSLSQAEIYVLDYASDDNYDDVMATNKQNAIDKNWAVKYHSDRTDIPATTGSYDCDTQTSVEDLNYSNFSVYPTVVNTGFTVEIDNNFDKHLTLEIYSLSGQTIHIETINSNKQYIDISTLKAGTYIVRLGNKTCKIVKE